ncbi:MAG: hypothetical protein SOZ09_05010 [Eubacteriales bacterium]|nr:hypothetical protein [Eubacteriales bacterium]
MTLQQTVSAENQPQKPRNTVAYFRFLLKNNWQQLALCGVLCFLIVFLPILLSTTELETRADYYDTQLSYAETVAKRAETQVETLGVLFVLTAGVIGVIFGMTANGYTNTKPSIHTYYSYPLRRDTLFVTEWLTRDLYFLLGGTVFYILSAVYIACRLTFSASLLACAAAYFLIGVVGYLMVFHIFQLSAALTGTMAFRFCMAGILAFLPVALYLLFVACVSNGMPNIYANYYLSDSVVRVLCPAYLMWQTALQFADFGAWDGTWIMALYAVICAAISLFLQVKRKSELSGSSVVWKTFQNIVKYLVIFTSGLFGGWLIALFFAARTLGWTLFGLLCGLVLSFLFMNVLIERSVKGMFRGLPGFGVTSIVTVFLYAVLFFDIFGLNSFMYADNMVSRVEVVLDTNGSGRESVTISDPESLHAILADIRALKTWSYGTEYERAAFYIDRDRSVSGEVPSMLASLADYDVTAYNEDTELSENSGKLFVLRNGVPPVEEFGSTAECLSTMTVRYIVYPKVGIPIARRGQIDMLTATDGFGEDLENSPEYRTYLLERTAAIDYENLQTGYVSLCGRIYEMIEPEVVANPRIVALMDAYRTAIENDMTHGAIVGRIVFWLRDSRGSSAVELPIYSDMTGVWQAFMDALDADLFHIEDIEVREDTVNDEGLTASWRETRGLTRECADFVDCLDRFFDELLVVEADTGRYWYVELETDRKAVLSAAARIGENVPGAIGCGRCDRTYLLAAYSAESGVYFTGLREGEVPDCVTAAFGK